MGGCSPCAAYAAGKPAGLRWSDVDLDARVAMIEQQRIGASAAFGRGLPTEYAVTYVQGHGARIR
jgi:hypothetical protein